MVFDPEMALMTVELSRLAYRPLDQAERNIEPLGLSGFRQFSGPSTQAFIAQDEQHLYLAFRGTESKNHVDWMRDAEFRPVPGVFGGRVHSGFRRALDEVWLELLDQIASTDRKLVITGHSLGGGLATLAAARLAAGDHTSEAIYTYGSPRVGLRDFAAAYQAALGNKTYRIINHIDIVTRVPFLVQGYRHVGSRMYFDGAGRFHRNAGGWQIAKDDLKTRLTHFGRISAVGLGPHDIPRYVERIESIQ
jgi:triacylglycerol lipase